MWNKKSIIILITSIFAISSVIYSLSITNKYKSEALLSITGSSDSEFSSLKQFGGLASLAGINLSSGSMEDKSDLAIETIRSREFLKHLISFDGVLAKLMAAKSIDENMAIDQYDPKLYDSRENKWVRKVKSNQSIVPSHIEAHKYYIEEILYTDINKTTGFITVGVEHISPVFAHDFLNLIINEVNKIVQQKDMNEAINSLNFLEQESINTQTKGVSDTINNLIQAQLEKKMLAKVRNEYLLMTIDKPFIPEKKSSPQRALICIIGTILGFLISCILIFVQNALFRADSNL